MKLTSTALAAALNITPQTLERWIRQGNIPVRMKEGSCTFSLFALRKWAKENNLTYQPKDEENTQEKQDHPDTLSTAMARGGLFYNIEGNSVKDILRAGVERIPCLTNPQQRETLVESLLAREKLMSTGIGNGVAIPHPRTPLDYGDVPAFITTCFLKQPVDYQAVDHQPVFVVFILACPTSKRHLQLLARISFCLRDETFIDFLQNIPKPDDFFRKIKELEQRFDSP